MKKIFLVLGLIFFTSCASSPAQHFQSITIGDEKGSVLSKLGNPSRTYYKEDTQRWVYSLKDGSAPVKEKEIWFQNGRVVYIDALQIKNAQETKKQIRFEPVE